jgi:hypothetical protein
MSLITNSSSQKTEPEILPHGLSTRMRQFGMTTSGNRKFQVEGPWNVGDPVHESLTNAALQNAGLIPKETPANDPIVWEYLRGIFWNDDPEGFFFDNNETETDNWSSGVTFLANFLSHKNDAANGVVFGPGSPLLARSHFGDLQCLHSMAARDGEPIAVTRAALIRWLEFFYSVANGTISGRDLLGALTVGRIKEWFPQSSLPVHRLFLIGQRGDIHHRAIGALLHVIQDSYAKGHVERNRSEAILEFHSYIHQDSSKHAHDDVIPPEGLSAMPGVQRAIQHCSKVLQLWKQSSNWQEVRSYLDAEVFHLAPNARPSSPGDAYRV